MTICACHTSTISSAFTSVRLVRWVISYKGEFIFLTVVFQDPFVNNSVRFGNNDIGLVAFYILEVLHLLAHNHRTAWCWHHGVTHNFKCPVVAAGQHGQGKGIQFIYKFRIGITGQITCSCFREQKEYRDDRWPTSARACVKYNLSWLSLTSLRSKSSSVSLNISATIPEYRYAVLLFLLHRRQARNV